MMNYLIEEFIAVVSYLRRQETSIEKKGYLFADKKLVLNLLNRNRYLKAEEKLGAWRDLGWIETDPKRLTSRICKNGQTILCIRIKLSVYDALNKWI